MTQDLRTSLNRLTHEVNYVIAYWLDVYNVGYTFPSDHKTSNTRYGTAIDIVDVDLLCKLSYLILSPCSWVNSNPVPNQMISTASAEKASVSPTDAIPTPGSSTIHYLVL